MVRFYDRALSTPNVAGLHTDPLATETAGNVGPEVSAGADQSVAYTAGAVLSGVVTDDGLTVTSLWRKIAGPGSPDFTAASLPATGATFDLPGVYQLWLEADDGEVKVYDDTEISVAPITYVEWAATNAPGSDPNEDFDNDGVPNAIEFVLGGDKDTNDIAKLPAVATSGGNMSFTFTRDRDSVDANVSVIIEVGNNLSTWPDVFTVGASTAGSSAGVTVTDHGNGTETITLTLPQALELRRYARLKVVVQE
jgi:hypothetical protein